VVARAGAGVRRSERSASQRSASDSGPNLRSRRSSHPDATAHATPTLARPLGRGGATSPPTPSDATLATLAASASYIAAPTAMRIAVPQANPSLSIGLALGVTFPFNVLVGIPLYIELARRAAGCRLISLPSRWSCRCLARAVAGGWGC
jgi:hypothetical protein